MDFISFFTDGLEKLKELRIQYNNLTTLPGDLFTRMKNLQKISFRGNKLKYLNRKLLDPIIEKAQEIDLRENVVICYYGVESLFYTGKGSQELLFQSLQSNFTSPIEDGVQGKFLENLTEGLKQIWETRKYSDFTIVVEKKEFPVHKNILSAHSSVFTTIFDINMKEREQSKLIITDFSVGSVRNFISILPNFHHFTLFRSKSSSNTFTPGQYLTKLTQWSSSRSPANTTFHPLKHIGRKL